MGQRLLQALGKRHQGSFIRRCCAPQWHLLFFFCVVVVVVGYVCPPSFQSIDWPFHSILLAMSKSDCGTFFSTWFKILRVFIRQASTAKRQGDLCSVSGGLAHNEPRIPTLTWFGIAVPGCVRSVSRKDQRLWSSGGRSSQPASFSLVLSS